MIIYHNVISAMKYLLDRKTQFLWDPIEISNNLLLTSMQE